MIKLYNTWGKAKDIFVKPSLKVYFGSIKKDPNRIPAGPPPIRLFNRNKYGISVYTVTDMAMVKTGTETKQWGDKEYNVDVYEYSTHKLPGNLKAYQLVWNGKIRRKLRKWGLGWFPPVIYLPYWMKFGIYNYDVGYKWKYDEIRYEFPPAFSIVFFGLSLTFSLHSPYHNTLCCDDHYWEAILNHLYNNKSGSLKETIEICGVWRRFGKNNEMTKYFAVRSGYINPSHLNEYFSAVSEIKAERGEVII